MKIRWAAALAGTALLICAVPVFAHHSFAVQCNANKPIEMKGLVSFTAQLMPKDDELLEYVCNENNQDVPYLVAPKQ